MCLETEINKILHEYDDLGLEKNDYIIELVQNDSDSVIYPILMLIIFGVVFLLALGTPRIPW